MVKFDLFQEIPGWLTTSKTIEDIFDKFFLQS